MCFYFCSSSVASVNEAPVKELSGSSMSTDVVDPDAEPAKPHDSKNAQRDATGSDNQPVEPREHRRPNRPGIVWAAGSKLEAKDFLDKWYIKFK